MGLYFDLQVVCFNVGEEAQEDIFQICASDEKACKRKEMYLMPPACLHTSYLYILCTNAPFTYIKVHQQVRKFATK